MKSDYIDPDAPRIFISSTLEDLKSEREEIKNAIETDLKYHCYAFESSGSVSPARERVLGTLKKSDIYVGIIGGRYGSDFKGDGERISGTEDEYNYALKWNKEILIYTKTVERDEKASRFLGRVREYSRGSITADFETTEELVNHFKKDIAKIFAKKLRENSKYSLKLLRGCIVNNKEKASLYSKSTRLSKLSKLRTFEIPKAIEDEEIDDLMEIEYITKDINDLIQEKNEITSFLPPAGLDLITSSRLEGTWMNLKENVNKLVKVSDNYLAKHSN
jgi:hypothetical protein